MQGPTNQIQTVFNPVFPLPAVRSQCAEVAGFFAHLFQAEPLVLCKCLYLVSDVYGPGLGVVATDSLCIRQLSWLLGTE